MGTGGATALLSPEICSDCRSKSLAAALRAPRDWSSVNGERWFFLPTTFHYHYSLGKERADPLTSTHRKRKYAFKASFCFGSFVSSVDWDRGQRPRPQRNRKVKDQAERVISTPELNMLPCLHPEPINVVVCHDPSGRSHLGIGLALRCFQRLSFPNIATQHCS